MKRLNALALPALLLVATVAVARDQQASPAAPVARRVPSSSTIHGETRVDEYAWLRDKTNPEVTAHLEAENAYANALIEPIAGFSKNLYGEMLGRIKQTDVNVPYLKNGWYYYSRTVEGKQYVIHARKRTLDGAEEIMLDVNKLGEGQKFMGIGALEVSDDGNLLAYSTDNTGYRQYRLQVKDLRTGRLLPDTAEKTGSVLWAKDNKTIFYTVENAAMFLQVVLYLFFYFQTLRR